MHFKLAVPSSNSRVSHGVVLYSVDDRVLLLDTSAAMEESNSPQIGRRPLGMGVIGRVQLDRVNIWPPEIVHVLAIL